MKLTSRVVQLILLLLVSCTQNAHSNDQEPVSGSEDVCTLTYITQLATTELLESMGEEVRQVHSDINQKHQDILTLMIQRQSDPGHSRIQETHADTQLSAEDIVTIVKRTEQLAVALQTMVSKLSEDMGVLKYNSEYIRTGLDVHQSAFTSQSQEREVEVTQCKRVLKQTNTRLNNIQQQLMAKENEAEQCGRELEATNVHLNDTKQDVYRLEDELEEAKADKDALEEQWSQEQRQHLATNVTLSELQDKLAEYGGCHPPFEEVPDLGCVYASPEEGKKTWDDARQSCREMGHNTDMYAGHGRSNLVAVQNYIDGKYDNNLWVWVGVQYEMWVDGVKATSEEWTSGDPQDDSPCALMWTGRDSYMYDHPCSEKIRFICQRRY